MSGINKAIILGRLGKDPESKTFSDGTAVCNFSVATSEGWKDKNTGEKKERTEWHRIVAYRKLAEICSQYLKKGQQVYVEGKIQTRKYDKDGQTYYATEIIADTMQMIGGKQDSSSGGGQEMHAAIDDIPF